MFIPNRLEPVGRIFMVRLVLRTDHEDAEDDATHLARGHCTNTLPALTNRSWPYGQPFLCTAGPSAG